MTRAAHLVERAHLVTLAGLTGLVALDPTARLRSAPDYAGWLAGQQRVDRVMSRVAPPLFLATTGTAAGAAVVALTRRRPAAAAARVAATACLAASIAVTLRVNEPANAALRGWRATDEPPAEWRAVRGRWERAHAARRALVAVAALASVAGLRTAGWRRG